MNKLYKIYVFFSVVEILLLILCLVIWESAGGNTKVGGNVYVDIIAITSVVNIFVTCIILLYKVVFYKV